MQLDLALLLLPAMQAAAYSSDAREAAYCVAEHAKE
jgi:hypothetical protein